MIYRNITINIIGHPMGVTKTANFTAQQNRIAQIAKVLGHPARIAILQHLIEQQSCVCGNLVEVLPLAQATVSQHLKELKAIGLIKGEVEGTSVCYCINEPAWEEAGAILAQLFQLPLSTACCSSNSLI